MTSLLNHALDLNFEAVDTSIAVNCHVLASTYYLEIDDDSPEASNQQDTSNQKS